MIAPQNGKIPQWKQKGKLETNKDDNVNVGEFKDDRVDNEESKVAMKESV